MDIEHLLNILKSKDYKDKDGNIIIFYKDTIYMNKKYGSKYDPNKIKQINEGIFEIPFSSYTPEYSDLVKNLVLIYNKDRRGYISILINFEQNIGANLSEAFSFITSVGII